MFIVKKLLSALLTPMPICLLLLTVGLALLWFSRRQRAGRVLVAVGTGLLILLSYSGVSRRVVAPLEGYRPLLVPDAPGAHDPQAGQARWIVVLGGGHTLAPGLPPTSQLHPNTLARLVEGVRLKRQIPGARLITSGGFGSEAVPHAEVVARAAEILGLTRDDIVLARDTFDTVDEARYIHALVGADPFILVTSASHLPRAVRLFRKQGMSPLPSPADFISPDTPGISIGSLFPSAGSLAATEHATHEYLGILFEWLRGQI
jgi:uncharacterized SAM-binding protein YcdF (DUF218 family)